MIPDIDIGVGEQSRNDGNGSMILEIAERQCGVHSNFRVSIFREVDERGQRFRSDRYHNLENAVEYGSISMFYAYLAHEFFESILPAASQQVFHGPAPDPPIRITESVYPGV